MPPGPSPAPPFLPLRAPQVVFVSQHSIEVDVKVYAENIITGTKRLTNQVGASASAKCCWAS